ncbi:hypothetical protein N7452_007501 [Penicillium brevicompactum]|uniref:Carboxylic ester hydrolase n=1 Tax=Penicillium brevicompactum TaxID=5074 RepID=A0A9W9UFT3_PENBR|nr:hypothetical protein N7452_007501 [Penicillium brevicompactum]
MSLDAMHLPTQPILYMRVGPTTHELFLQVVSKLCHSETAHRDYVVDPSSLLSRSVYLNKPIIIVTVNYRLNIFAFGDETSDPNLALKDQRAALEYVRLHIAGFGGDPENITIAGESAGAMYSHAHAVMGAPVRQCILQSGTMYLSPPQPPEATSALRKRLSIILSSLGGYDLRTASASHLLEAQAKMGLMSYYIQMEPKLEGWQQKWGNVERIAIGDNEYESAIWKIGIDALEPSTICSAFDLAGSCEKAKLLKRVYGIVPSRAISCKLGALDFLNDVRFTLPTGLVIEQSRRARRPVFGFLIDQPNPWQSSSRAHHGVDLLYLFRGFTFPDQSAWKVSEEMQRKWIEFISGEDPWQEGRFYAFGPFGRCEEVNVADRRRYRHLDAVLEAGPQNIEAVFKAIAAGRTSLLS